jgi:hypothetical protein
VSAAGRLQTREGTAWTLRGLSFAGEGLYAPEAVRCCPQQLLVTAGELAEHGVRTLVGQEDVAELDVAVQVAVLKGLLAPAEAAAPLSAVPESRCVEDELTGARLSLWEEEQENARLRARVAELEDVERRLLDLLPTEPLPAVMLAEDIPAARSEWAVWQQVAEALDVQLPYVRPVDEDPIPYQQTEAADAAGPEVTVYRASHDSIVMGLYTAREAAMDHVHAVLANEEGCDVTARVIWRADDPEADEPVWECWLFDSDMADDEPTGYVVTPLEVASAYDEEADE